jgi:transcriptional regulator with XRE-family HTH domain
LAADNLAALCAGCQRTARDKLVAPPSVPPTFWETDELRDAFAAQHMGRVARAYRRHPFHVPVYGPLGITQTLLGQWLGISQPQVNRIENGAAQRHIDTLTHWARVLGIPPDLLWFDLPGSRRDPRQSPGPTEDVIDVLERIRTLSRRVDPEIVRHLHENTRETVARYETLDHSDLVPAMTKQRIWLDSLLNESAGTRQRQQLFEIAGTTSGILGYVAVGRGEFPLARAYCLEAFQLGDAAQNRDLQAWARGMQSFCEYYAGRYDEALRFAQDGLAHARSGPQSVRLITNGLARSLGRLGDAEGVHRAVDKAYELLSSNEVPSGVPSSISFDCYSAAQTASNAATAYVSLGMPNKVQHYVDLALPDISDSDSPWSHSLVLVDLAISMIRSEGAGADLDRSTEIVIEALALSAGRPIISIEHRTLEFTRAAAGRWGDVQQVRSVREALSTFRHPVERTG